MFPIISSLKKSDNVVKVLACDFSGRNPEVETQTHIIVQRGKTQLDLYQVKDDDTVSLKYLKSMPVYAGIAFVEKIRHQSKDYLLLLTADLSARLLTLEAEESGSSLAPELSFAESLTVASSLSLENLDATMCAFFSHERDVSHFCYNFGAAVLSFSGSDMVLVLLLDDSPQGLLQLLEWQVDTLEGLEQAIDVNHCIEDDGALKILILCEAQGEEIDYYQRDVKDPEGREQEKTNNGKEK